jgi:starch-binding outer membrane protein, SusD/RagB family
MRMRMRFSEVGLVAALVLVAGCGSLDISDPNDLDSQRALSQPAAIRAIAVGGFRTWYLTTQGGFGEDQYPTLTMGVMARSQAAMWNNFNIRFYTGCTNAAWDVYTTATNGTCGPQVEGPAYPRVAWQNNLASAQRTQIEALWYGYYGALTSAKNVLKAIRTLGLVIDDTATTKMVETMAVLTQGLALSGIALNYDKGFIVDYNTNLDSVTFSTRQQVRDAAIAKFDEVIALTGTHTFVVPPEFFGAPALSYDNVKIRQIANTMAARTLAYYPRTAAENVDASTGGEVNWAQVATYAAAGISSGTPFDLTFHQDACISWCDFLKVWSNDMTTMRIHTRVAYMMDPATQKDPYDTVALVRPNSPDKRLGNGYYRGDSAYAAAILRTGVDAVNGGYDYVWTSTGTFGNKTRGLWHQSAVGQVRYDSLTTCGDNPQGEATGSGDAPMILAAENDLIWAEALIREPSQDLATAATLINYTRVGPDRLGHPRGGLAVAAAGDGTAGLLAKLQYEQDVELPGSNIAPFFNQRRIDKLEPLTPHEFPVPAKELGVLKLCFGACYSWGGSDPVSSTPTAPAPIPGMNATVQGWTPAGASGTKGSVYGPGTGRRQ